MSSFDKQDNVSANEVGEEQRSLENAVDKESTSATPSTLKRVYETESNDDASLGNETDGDRLSKRAKTLFDEFFEDTVEVQFTGWELVLSLDISRIIDAFTPMQREKIKSLHNNLQELINKYAQRPAKFIESLAKEHGLSGTDEVFASNDPKIVNVLTKYNLTSDNFYNISYVWLEVPASDMDNIYGMISSLFGIISVQKNIKLLKNDAIVEKMKRATNVACFKPFFHNFNHGFIFGNIKSSLDETAFGVTNLNTPIVNLDGSLLVVAERCKSRGVNKSENTFDVLNVVNPSLKIIREAFRLLLDRRYPSLKFTKDYIFVNITEASNTPRIQCLKMQPAWSHYVIVACNLSGIRISQFKSSATPIVHMYANCVFESMK